MKKLLSVLLVGVFTTSLGASAFAADASKDKLVAENATSQHKLMDKTHKSHKADKAIKAEKSASGH